MEHIPEDKASSEYIAKKQEAIRLLGSLMQKTPMSTQELFEFAAGQMAMVEILSAALHSTGTHLHRARTAINLFSKLGNDCVALANLDDVYFPEIVRGVDAAASQTKRTTASAGGKGRHAKSDEVRLYAITQYEKESDVYASPREASGLLAQDILNYAISIGAQDKKNFKDVFQVRDTTYKWLLKYKKLQKQAKINGKNT